MKLVVERSIPRNKYTRAGKEGTLAEMPERRSQVPVS
jgi:hypothetical protein